MLSTSKNIVIGASGLIGGALYDQFKKNSQEVIGTHTHHPRMQDLIKFDMEGDDFADLCEFVGAGDNVYIMSAYSSPSWIYKNREAAEKLNLTGTIRLIEALRLKNPRIIFMSSVEVFDGVKGKYMEFDQPNPLNYYGVLKFEIEKYLKNNFAKSTIIRTGWNVGLDVRSRCVVKLTYDSLLEPNARMANDNYFSISDVRDTAEVLRLLSGHPEVRELHICADEVINRAALAKLIQQTSKNGHKMGYKECSFFDIEYSEPRGRVSDLDNSLSKAVLGASYRKALDIIADKVKFIDAQQQG